MVALGQQQIDSVMKTAIFLVPVIYTELKSPSPLLYLSKTDMYS
jgi:hypothetical protein